MNAHDYIDNTRPQLDLGDVGTVMSAIRHDGSTSYWLIVPTANDIPVATPRHEQLGPLPHGFMDTHHRCGSPRTDGHPCRALVTQATDRCHWHQHDNSRS